MNSWARTWMRYLTVMRKRDCRFYFIYFRKSRDCFFFILIGCEKSQSYKTHPTRTRRIRFISENWQEIKINILKFTSNLSGFVGVHLNFWKDLEFSLNLLYFFEINNLNDIRKIFFSRKTFPICFPLKQFTQFEVILRNVFTCFVLCLLFFPYANKIMHTKNGNTLYVVSS